MALLGDPALRPSLAEQAQQRTVAPAAELHGHPHKEQDHEHAFKCEEDIRIASVALAAVAVWFDLWEPFANVSVIGILGLIVGGWPIFKPKFLLLRA
jgi:Cd2+/Zn2+-exporting ATPase/Cu+-exporting ATPase